MPNSDDPKPPSLPLSSDSISYATDSSLLLEDSQPSIPSGSEPASIQKDVSALRSLVAGESSGSDHLSDSSKAGSRPSSRPRCVSESQAKRSSLSSSPLVLPSESTSTHTTIAPEEISSTLSKLSLESAQGSKIDVPLTRPTLTTSLSSPPTPSTDSANRTYSFVFTSSKQPKTVGGDGIIGVVNPSLSRPTFSRRTSGSPPISRSPSLTPEQIRAHALGAIHATPESSPFQRSTATVAQLVSSPVISEPEDPMDRSFKAHGIDFYVNAVRQGRSSVTEDIRQSRQVQQRQSSYSATLPSLEETLGVAASRDLISADTSNAIAQAHTKSKKRKTRSYARYVEEDSDQPQFTTNSVPRQRDRSQGSSASSSNSKASFNESITGLSCFGVIGSGSPRNVFGDAVLDASNPQVMARRGSQAQQSVSSSNTSSATPTQASEAAKSLETNNNIYPGSHSTNT